MVPGQDGYVCPPQYDDDDDDDDDLEALIARVPEDTSALEDAATASHGVILLLVLKQHLKDTYGLTDK
jgi:cohesin loading factor subunit SCC2